LIHTDLKIENILLTSDREIVFDRHGTKVPERTKIKLIDFGGACYDHSKKSTIVNTRQYRAPEVILETGWSMPSDIWSAGCILVELYQGELLFPTHSNLEHLALMEHVIGPFPRRMLQHAKATDLVTEAFDRHGRHRRTRVLSSEHETFVRQSPTLDQILHRSLDVQSQPLAQAPPLPPSSPTRACSSSDPWFGRLLHQMLVIDPLVRSTAHECLLDLARMRRRNVRYA
jgi:serine/threonine protein kinase